MGSASLGRRARASALFGAGLVVELVNIEELHDLDAAELVRVGAHASWVRVCRVAELPHANADAL